MLQNLPSYTPRLPPADPRALPAEHQRSDFYVVLGTYNRRVHLERCLGSVRAACRALDHPPEFVVVDAGSTDGTREWLAGQEDVVLLGHRAPLPGAVRAFNDGFRYALSRGAKFVFHFNDDCELTWDADLSSELARFDDPKVGGVALPYNPPWYHGQFGYSVVFGRLYSNYGIFRRETMEAVAKVQGDKAGRLFWNPLYRTYGADVEASMWTWKLGYTIIEGASRVIDLRVKDALRTHNGGDDDVCLNRDRMIMQGRWKDADCADPSKPEAGPECEGLLRAIDVLT